MNPQIADVFRTFLTILMFCVIGRSLISWFPVPRDHAIVRLLDQITEPLLQPVRKIMPSTGMIDLSGMVVIFVLIMMTYVVDAVERQ